MPAKQTNNDKGSLTQWQLIRLRFCKHRLALLSLYILGIFYLVAVFAEFFAPNGKDERYPEYRFAPPMVPAFSLSEGFYIHPLKKQQDPVTLELHYIKDTTRRLPLGFFVEGDSYSLFGLIESDLHFFGLDREAMAGLDSPTEASPAVFFLFGGDDLGHDLFSRIIYGARISLFIGFIAISITFFIGTLVGGISGYLGGRTDLVIQRIIEIVSSFPELPLWLALAAAVPRDWSPVQVYVAISVLLSFLYWTSLARVVRGKILSLREEDYAMAARLLGASHGRIIFRHLIPGFTSHIIVTLTLRIPGMILGETALSFLGLGLRPPVVSWGVMLQNCTNMEVVVKYPWMLAPVIFIIITVLTFNFLGDGIRDAADPYS
jgi:peptide/nickel transport system permease protein